MNFFFNNNDMDCFSSLSYVSGCVMLDVAIYLDHPEALRQLLVP